MAGSWMFPPEPYMLTAGLLGAEWIMGLRAALLLGAGACRTEVDDWAVPLPSSPSLLSASCPPCTEQLSSTRPSALPPCPEPGDYDSKQASAPLSFGLRVLCLSSKKRDADRTVTSGGHFRLGVATSAACCPLPLTRTGAGCDQAKGDCAKAVALQASYLES